MQRFYTWLREHRAIHVLLLISYYCLIVLPHEFIGVTIAGIFEGQPRAEYDRTILILALSLGLAVGIPYLIRLLRGSRIILKLGYLLMTIGLIVLCMKTIIIVNIELIHIIQYAVFAVLAYPLFGSYVVTLIFTTWVGATDEAYQYFYLAPQRTEYYDLNDVVFNTLGGGIGLLWIWNHNIKSRYTRLRSIIASVPLWLTIITVICVTALIFFGVMAYYPTESVDPLWTLVRVKPPGFWSVVHPNITFHVTLPIEGICYCLTLWLFYLPIDRIQSNIS